jgi:hypothetical protein
MPLKYFIKRHNLYSTPFEVLPEVKRIVHVSLDSEYYSSSVINYLMKKEG